MGKKLNEFSIRIAIQCYYNICINYKEGPQMT